MSSKKRNVYAAEQRSQESARQHADRDDLSRCSLRIKTFTPGMTDLFHLRDSDRGRPITEIVTRLNYDDLRREVGKVLRTLSVIEHEVQIAEDGTSFIMRIRPYRTVDNVIDGVVITFVDITERKRYEEDRARLAAIVDSSQDAIIGHAFDGLITSWNAGAERVFGFTADEAIGKAPRHTASAGSGRRHAQVLERLKRGERVEHFEIDRLRKDGKLIDVSLTISPINAGSGRMIEPRPSRGSSPSESWPKIIRV
jgi:two-component system CheB/CheR fusion protein